MNEDLLVGKTLQLYHLILLNFFLQAKYGSGRASKQRVYSRLKFETVSQLILMVS